MEFTVRRAESSDLEALMELIAALANYESLKGPDAEAQARFKAHGWPEDNAAPRFMAWLLEATEEGQNEKRAIGYAITFETYSSFLCRPTFYIEDIFILPDCRGGGAGRLLMDRLMAEARAGGCGRMEWIVLDWNEPAQRFYQRLGARELPEWQFYRLDLG